MKHSKSFHIIWAFVWNRDPIESANQKTEKLKFTFKKNALNSTRSARIQMNKRVCVCARAGAQFQYIFGFFLQTYCE